MNYETLTMILGEIQAVLPARVREIHQTQNDILQLEIFSPLLKKNSDGNQWLTLVNKNHYQSIFFTSSKFSKYLKQGNWQQILRKYLENSLFHQIDIAPALNRTYAMTFSKENDFFALVIEVFRGGHWYLYKKNTSDFVTLLYTSNAKILSLSNTHIIHNASAYKLVSPYGDNEKFLQSNADEFHKFSEQDIAAKKTNISEILKLRLKKLEQLKTRLEQDLIQLEHYEHFRKYGELLKYVSSKNIKGLSVIQVTDYFSTELREIEIPLLPEKTLSENMNWYFQKSQKYERGYEKIFSRLYQTESEIKEAKQLLDNLNNVKSDEIENLLQQIDTSHRSIKISARRKKDIPKRPYYIFHQNDNEGKEIYRILIGRNDSGNDYITFQMAKGNDLWFHIHQYPGSHVILQFLTGHEQKKTYEEQARKQAMNLAAFFSSRKKDDNVEMIVTEAKWVTKPKHAKAGKVIVHHEKIYPLRVNRELIDNLREHLE